MKRLLTLMPRTVLLSVTVLVAVMVAFVAAVVFLGGARDGAIEEHARLESEIQRTRTAIATAQTDYDYVVENRAKYESLLESDRLVPHTRRAAVLELQKIAEQNGIPELNYSFEASRANAPSAAGSGNAAGAFRLSVEDVKLTMSAPFDGPLYGFVADITEKFPGAAVVNTLKLSRVDSVTDEALKGVSEGRSGSIVDAELIISWRTAQAVDKAEAK